MTWGKLIVTWAVIGVMFFAATVVNHHFYLLISKEMRQGYQNIEESIAAAASRNTGVTEGYFEQIRELIAMTKDQKQRGERNIRLMESIERDLTDIRIWISGIQEKVEKVEEQSDKPAQ